MLEELKVTGKTFHLKLYLFIVNFIEKFKKKKNGRSTCGKKRALTTGMFIF